MMSATGRAADSKEAKLKPRSGCVLKGTCGGGKWSEPEVGSSQSQEEHGAVRNELTASAVECPKNQQVHRSGALVALTPVGQWPPQRQLASLHPSKANPSRAASSSSATVRKLQRTERGL